MKRFLILQPAFLGDVILSLCIPQKLKRFFPDAEVHILIRKGFENIIVNHPDIDKVWLLDRNQNKVSELFRLISQLRNYDFDLTINLHRFFSSGIIASGIRTKIRVGFDKNPFSFFYDHKIKHFFSEANSVNPLHEVERNLLLIESFTDKSFERPKIYPSKSDYEATIEYKSKGSYLVVAPSSLWQTKRFPINKWEEFLKFTSDKYQIYIIGSKDDIPIGKQLTSVNPCKIVNLCGKLTLLQSAALMDGALRVFSNDSAPTHLATAVNAPITTIFCSTVPAFGFGPLSEDHKTVEIDKQLDCRPCGLHGHKACPKGHFKCGNEISTEQLILTLNNFL